MGDPNHLLTTGMILQVFVGLQQWAPGKTVGSIPASILRHWGDDHRLHWVEISHLQLEAGTRHWL